MLVVVIVNPQGGLFEKETGGKAECDVLSPAAAAGKGKTEWSAWFDGLRAGTSDLHHVGLEGAHEGVCRKALDVEPDYELVVFG